MVPSYTYIGIASHVYDVGLCERRREAMSVYVLDGVDAGENKKHRCIKFISLKGDVIRNIAFFVSFVGV